MIKRIAIAAVLLLAGIGAFWYARSRKRSNSLELSGTIEARDVEVGSLVGGRVSAVLVDEGAVVRNGQTLVVLESDLLDRQIREEEGRLAGQKAGLARTVHGPRREEVERTRVTYENADRERSRLAALRREGVIAQQQYDDAAAAARTAEQSYRELARGSRAEDVDQARAAVAAEEGRLSYLKRQKEELTVRAPADGVIQSIDLRPGDLVSAAQPVATILEQGQLWVRVYVPEPRLATVRVGEAADVAVDGDPGRNFPGKVIEIRPQAEYTPRNIQTREQRSEQVFGVKVAVAPDPALKPGMAATVRLRP